MGESQGVLSIGSFGGVAYHVSSTQSGIAVGVGNHIASISLTNTSISIHIGFTD